ncbi:uncharacterized protein LOC113172451 [Anabas testudineus]|uniref:Uncharacterized protein n=1 Tax=Anabas testudineus TaxID=64144 RepID=A0A3Q1HJ76_ANATE|nr:uncharacterized protein LOC113172451 [Anabas testudineus]
MTRVKDVLGVLLLSSLLHSGVRCKKDAQFVYSTLGGSALLPCTNLVSPDCALISWTFYKGGDRYIHEVSEGQVVAGLEKSNRMSVTSNCSLHLRDLRVDDVGSYGCVHHVDVVTDVYLSVLTITSPSKLTDLQPGGNLSLSCILFTYYDAGSCKSYSSVFSLRWMDEDETPLSRNGRYEIRGQSRCNITLVTKLQGEDSNRRWRCQVITSENRRAVFQDFRSIFLFQNPPTVPNLTPSAAMHCPVELPISRIVLCVALPIMVFIVGLFTWRTDRKHLAKTSAADIELQQMNC